MPKTRFHQLLEKRVMEEIEAKQASIISGQCVDFPSYRFEVGYLRGLYDALNLCDQINEDFDK